MNAPRISRKPDSLTVERILHPEREGWSCSDCEQETPTPADWLVGEAPNLRPVCRWHRDEAIHDAIPYGHNCPDCGREHSALWDEDITA